MKFRILPERLAVCRLAPEAPVPAWALQGKLFSITCTPDELSIVCLEDHAIEASSGEGGWVALKLEGPFPFSMTGVLASFLHPLAEAQIPIFAISTFDTDYVLIKHEDLNAANTALTAARTPIEWKTPLLNARRVESPFNLIFAPNAGLNWVF